MTNHWLDKFSLILITFWVGALWTTGAVAYSLFHTLEDHQLAGQLAGQFFTYVSYLGLFSDAFPADVMQSVFANRFKAWHGVASIAYVVQCLLGFVVVVKK